MYSARVKGASAPGLFWTLFFAVLFPLCSTLLITAVMEMYGRFLKDAGGRWPMFIIITSDGPEGSGQVDPAKFTAMMQDMQMKDVVVHAIVMSTMGRGMEVQVTRALTQATDGHYDSISVASALSQKLTTLGGAISNKINTLAATISG